MEMILEQKFTCIGKGHGAPCIPASREEWEATEVGKAVMTRDGKLFKGDDDALKAALAAGDLEFHEGTIGGAWPRIIG